MRRLALPLPGYHERIDPMHSGLAFPPRDVCEEVPTDLRSGYQCRIIRLPAIVEEPDESLTVTTDLLMLHPSFGTSQERLTRPHEASGSQTDATPHRRNTPEVPGTTGTDLLPRNRITAPPPPLPPPRRLRAVQLGQPPMSGSPPSPALLMLAV